MDPLSQLPDSILWSEGMLLSPQHFQQNDLVWQDHLRHRLSCITPHFWGIKHLKIDTTNLFSGMVSIIELECILPDGLAIIFPSSSQHLSIDVPVGDLAKVDGRPIRVWVKANPRSPHSAKFDSAERRYDNTEALKTADETTGIGEIEVGRLRPHFSLHIDDASKPAPAGRSACPLFDVMRDAQGHLCMSDYHPPMINLGASEFLGDTGLALQLQQTLVKIWSKIEELATSVSDDKSDADSTIGTLISSARILACALPQMEICIHDPSSSLVDAYRAVSLMVGQIAQIGPQPTPLKMKPYVHHDCMPQFKAAIQFIEARLRLVSTEYKSVQFVAADVEGIGAVRFTRWLPADIENELIVELRLKEGQTLADVQAWLNDTRIVSSNLMKVVQQTRVPGARIRLLTSKEIKDRKLKQDAALFMIENQAVNIAGKGLQNAFRPDTHLLVHGPEDARMPAAIFLYRRKDSGKTKAPNKSTKSTDSQSDAPLRSHPHEGPHV